MKKKIIYISWNPGKTDKTVGVMVFMDLSANI